MWNGNRVFTIHICWIVEWISRTFQCVIYQNATFWRNNSIGTLFLLYMLLKGCFKRFDSEQKLPTKHKQLAGGHKLPKAAMTKVVKGRNRKPWKNYVQLWRSLRTCQAHMLMFSLQPLADIWTFWALPCPVMVTFEIQLVSLKHPDCEVQQENSRKNDEEKDGILEHDSLSSDIKSDESLGTIANHEGNGNAVKQKI